MESQALRRYYAIFEGDERARYLMTKEVPVDASLDGDEDTLWAAHDKGLREPTDRNGQTLMDVKVELADRMLSNCRLCERECGADRKAGERGHCGVLGPRISSEFIHMGEEPELVPSYTVFFSGCTFNCVYCQNWDISTRPDAGTEISPKTLARKIESKDPRFGGGRASTAFSGHARNINWVGGDPTSNLPFILETLNECRANLPQVWNSNMYLTEKSMRLLDGIVDVYLSDFKYGNDECAQLLSNAARYTSVVKRNHIIARSQAEMIIRHLVLPGHLDCCTRPVLTWIAENLVDVKVNVMAQYRPEHRAKEFPGISRSLRLGEYESAVRLADDLGLDLCD
jgi:putative pyruvate formate lyase activating enzyme